MKINFMIAAIVAVSMNVVSRAEDLRRTVAVSALSEIEVEADEALIAFRVYTEDRDLIEASNLNESRTREVLKRIKELGIAAEFVRMNDFDVSRDIDHHREFRGFIVQRSFQCRLHAFEKIHPLLSGLLESGVEHIDRVKYQLKSQRAAQRTARKIAFEIAKEKAESWAELSQLKLGKVIAVKENVQFNNDAGGGGGFGGMGFGDLGVQSNEPVVNNRPGNNRHSNVAAVQLVSMQKKKDEAPKAGNADKDKDKNNEAQESLLPPGMLSITATVTIIFEVVE